MAPKSRETPNEIDERTRNGGAETRNSFVVRGHFYCVVVSFAFSLLAVENGYSANVGDHFLRESYRLRVPLLRGRAYFCAKSLSSFVMNAMRTATATRTIAIRQSMKSVVVPGVVVDGS
jgi:hypothetical protein